MIEYNVEKGIIAHNLEWLLILLIYDKLDSIDYKDLF